MSGLPPAGTHPSLERDECLDGVRGLALLMVLSIHCFAPWPGGALTTQLANMTQSMFVAVDLFFVLSGFLITSILIRTRGNQNFFLSFYWRRGLRILPVYFLVLIYAFGILPGFVFAPGEPGAAREQLGWYLTYLQNIGILVNSEQPPWVGISHLWSLAIEEQFYLVWPLAIWLVPREHLQRFCLGLFVLGAGFKLAMLFSGASWPTLYLLTPCRIEGLALGGWIAARVQTGGPLRPPALLHVGGAIAAIGLLALILSPAPATELKARTPVLVVAHTLGASIAFAWMIYLIIGAAPGALIRRFFALKPLIFLGTYSYGIYVIHWMLLNQLHPQLMRLHPLISPNLYVLVEGGVTMALTVPLAMLMFRYVERPALSLKDLVPTGRKAAPSGPARAPVAT